MFNMDSSAISIRRALAADVTALETVREASWPMIDGVPLLQHLEASGTFTYLAEDDSPFGFVTVGSCETGLADGEILEWFLLQSHQERTLGRRLLVHGLSVLKRRLCENAFIWVPVEATRAREVLLRQEFEDSGACRERNTSTGVISETGFRKDLSDFF